MVLVFRFLRELYKQEITGQVFGYCYFPGQQKSEQRNHVPKRVMHGKAIFSSRDRTGYPGDTPGKIQGAADPAGHHYPGMEGIPPCDP